MLCELRKFHLENDVVLGSVEWLMVLTGLYDPRSWAKRCFRGLQVPSINQDKMKKRNSLTDRLTGNLSDYQSESTYP